jgi:hypothetical protein
MRRGMISPRGNGNRNRRVMGGRKEKEFACEIAKGAKGINSKGEGTDMIRVEMGNDWFVAKFSMCCFVVRLVYKGGRGFRGKRGGRRSRRGDGDNGGIDYYVREGGREGGWRKEADVSRAVVLENGRDKVMWFKVDIVGSKSERGETKNSIKAVTELIMESDFRGWRSWINDRQI